MNKNRNNIPKPLEKRIQLTRFGVTTRFAFFLFFILLLPMTITGLLIEKGMLMPGKNVYLAIPLFFLFLLIPLARFIAYHMINKDLALIDKFCTEIKKKNFSHSFIVPDQKEGEDTLITLQRNLNWMCRNLECQVNTSRDHVNKLRNDYKTAQKQAFTDSLTGLYNRRYLQAFFESKKGARNFCALSVIYIDCDHFKQVNDTKGHATGDDLLVWLANCLKASCRMDQDIPIRLGGDEFVLLLINLPLERSIAIGQRIQSLYQLKETHGTTLSMGLAELPCQEYPIWPSVEFLIKEADQQAYLVKKDGGNNIAARNTFIAMYKEGSKPEQKVTSIDPLAELPNRYLAKERFQQALKRTRRNNSKLCLLFLGIDNFKTINDSLGHRIGDKYLLHIIQCIQGVVEEKGSVYRLGGDEFIILLENILSKDDVPAMVAKIGDAVRQSAQIEEHHVKTTSSIGITLVPDDGNNFDDLCRRADIALNEAKEQGKNQYCFFDPKTAEVVKESLILITDMRSALPLGQMELYFQPQIDLVDLQVVGGEALIRWNHQDRGVLTPETFISLAERSGQIVEIGNWIIDQACRQCAEWKKAGIKKPVVVINISPIQIKRSNIAEIVLKAIEKYGLQGRNVELECTESLLLEDDQGIWKDLAVLREKGVQLAIDDFGTGYYNLKHIKQFNISALKIDMSFVRGVATNPHDLAIVDTIIKMSKSLQLTTVAEGIENAKTLQMLQMMQCDIGQGYYWGLPLKADQYLDYCLKHSGTTCISPHSSGS